MNNRAVWIATVLLVCLSIYFSYQSHLQMIKMRRLANLVANLTEPPSEYPVPYHPETTLEKTGICWRKVDWPEMSEQRTATGFFLLEPQMTGLCFATRAECEQTSKTQCQADIHSTGYWSQ